MLPQLELFHDVLDVLLIIILFEMMSLNVAMSDYRSFIGLQEWLSCNIFG